MKPGVLGEPGTAPQRALGPKQVIYTLWTPVCFSTKWTDKSDRSKDSSLSSYRQGLQKSLTSLRQAVFCAFFPGET